MDVEVDSPGPSTVIKSIFLRARAGRARIHFPKDLEVCVYLQTVFQEQFASPKLLLLECMVLLCICTNIHFIFTENSSVYLCGFNSQSAAAVGKFWKH